ncbi:MAG: preprotein translocase subunit YajC [Victivallaceae bacterium]|nr:preprotein translocase subunit YajC [Victivallaceae bacterium]
MFNSVAIAAAAAPDSCPASAQQGPAGLISFIPMILIFVVMFYFMFRSQKKQAQKRQQMIDSVVKGADVIIAGGIYGKVITVKDKTFIIQIADKVNVEITKAGLNGLVSDHPQTAE